MAGAAAPGTGAVATNWNPVLGTTQVSLTYITQIQRGYWNAWNLHYRQNQYFSSQTPPPHINPRDFNKLPEYQKRQVGVANIAGSNLYARNTFNTQKQYARQVAPLPRPSLASRPVLSYRPTTPYGRTNVATAVNRMENSSENRSLLSRSIFTPSAPSKYGNIVSNGINFNRSIFNSTNRRI